MTHLKNQNSKKCLSILRQIIAEASLSGEKKNTAVLALDHLQEITAGSGNPNLRNCIGKPLVEVSLSEN